MHHGLTIAPHGALDLVSLGALVHRLDPGTSPFGKLTTVRFTSVEANSMLPLISRTASACRPVSSRPWSTIHRRVDQRARKSDGRQTVL